jgi:hypothetical protein
VPGQPSRKVHRSLLLLLMLSSSPVVPQRPRTPSSNLEEEKSPSPAVVTNCCRPKVGKMSTPHRPDAIGLNRVENQAPDRSDCEALTISYGTTALGLPTTIPSAAPAGRSTVVHPSKNRQSGLEPIHTPSSSRSRSLIQVLTATV